MRIYGIINNDGCLIDTSLTERGAKRHATNNGYTTIGYRIEYHVTVVATKLNNKWVKWDKIKAF